MRRGIVHRFHPQAREAAHRLAIFEHVEKHAPREVHRHREADAHIAAEAADDGRIDADEPPARIAQRAAAVARIDRRIRLDEVLVAVRARQLDARAVRGRDHAHRRGDADLERIADGENEIADLDLRAVGHRQRGQILRVDLDHRDVHLRVRADDLRRQPPFVGKLDDDFVRQFSVLEMHDVAVREDVAVGGNDHARADAVKAILLLVVRFFRAEKALEQFVFRHLTRLRQPRGKDAHHARRDALHHVGEAGRALLLRAVGRRHLLRKMGRGLARIERRLFRTGCGCK